MHCLHMSLIKTQPPSKGVSLKMSWTIKKQVKHFALKPQLFTPKSLAFLTKYDCFKLMVLFKLKSLASYNCYEWWTNAGVACEEHKGTTWLMPSKKLSNSLCLPCENTFWWFSEVDRLNKYLKACRNFVQDSSEVPAVCGGNASHGDGRGHSPQPAALATSRRRRMQELPQSPRAPNTSGETGRKDAPMRVVLSYLSTTNLFQYHQAS